MMRLENLERWSIDVVEHEADYNGQSPDDPGALTRNELFAHALAFAEETVPWNV